MYHDYIICGKKIDYWIIIRNEKLLFTCTRVELFWKRSPLHSLVINKLIRVLVTTCVSIMVRKYIKYESLPVQSKHIEQCPKMFHKLWLIMLELLLFFRGSNLQVDAENISEWAWVHLTTLLLMCFYNIYLHLNIFLKHIC